MEFLDRFVGRGGGVKERFLPLSFSGGGGGEQLLDSLNFLIGVTFLGGEIKTRTGELLLRGETDIRFGDLLLFGETESQAGDSLLFGETESRPGDSLRLEEMESRADEILLFGDFDKLFLGEGEGLLLREDKSRAGLFSSALLEREGFNSSFV